MFTGVDSGGRESVRSVALGATCLIRFSRVESTKLDLFGSMSLPRSQQVMVVVAQPQAPSLGPGPAGLARHVDEQRWQLPRP